MLNALKNVYSGFVIVASGQKMHCNGTVLSGVLSKCIAIIIHITYCKTPSSMFYFVLIPYFFNMNIILSLMFILLTAFIWFLGWKVTKSPLAMIIDFFLSICFVIVFFYLAKYS